VVFSLLFLVLLWRLGKEIGDRDVGRVALLAGSLLAPAIHVARLARYLSAALALGAACGLFVWRASEKGRWRDFLLGGLFFGLLFHTHLVSFAILLGTTACMLPFILRHRRAAAKLAVSGLLVAAMTLPWIFLSGFLERPAKTPMAWSVLPPFQWLFGPLLGSRRVTLLVAAALLLLPVLRLLPTRRGRDEAAAGGDPLLERWRPYYFLGTWLAVGYLASSFLYPAASYWLTRIFNPLLPPGVVLTAMAIVAGWRRLRGWRPGAWGPVSGSPVPGSPAPGGGVLAPCLTALVLLWATRLGEIAAPEPPSRVSVYEFIEHLRGRTLEPGTRIYSTPNSHLILMLYTGLPVQSIAPVRREFLDNYPGPLLIVECTSRYHFLAGEELLRLAADAGVTLTEEEVDAWQARLSRRLVQEDLSGKVAEVVPPLDDIPAWAAAAAAMQRRTLPGRTATNSSVEDCPAIFQGIALPDYSYWWPIFFYRFVGPEARLGEHLNYARRVRRARALVLDSSWVVYDCPPPAVPDGPPR
jgi:hypothetical protein